MVYEHTLISAPCIGFMPSLHSIFSSSVISCRMSTKPPRSSLLYSPFSSRSLSSAWSSSISVSLDIVTNSLPSLTWLCTLFASNGCRTPFAVRLIVCTKHQTCAASPGNAERRSLSFPTITVLADALSQVRDIFFKNGMFSTPILNFAMALTLSSIL